MSALLATGDRARVQDAAESFLASLEHKDSLEHTGTPEHMAQPPGSVAIAWPGDRQPRFSNPP